MAMSFFTLASVISIVLWYSALETIEAVVECGLQIIASNRKRRYQEFEEVNAVDKEAKSTS